MCPAVLDRDVLTFAITCFSKTLAECRYLRGVFGRLRIEEPNYRHRRLLRARRERPRDRRTADERDEVAPLHLRRHSITSSATASSAGENVKPRALAAFRFRTSSNLSSRITGRSAGLAPLRTFPV